MVSARGGYHGHTGLAVAAGDGEYRDVFGPNLPGFVQVPFGNLDALAAVVDKDTSLPGTGNGPATSGMAVPPEGYLGDVRALCREWGARLILDEVQTGLGRTGSYWYYEQEGITPNALITGKGLGGGIYPMSAVLLDSEMAAIFHDHPFVHIATFGGAELGCVAALAVLDVVEEPGFLDRVGELGERFEEAFSGLPFELRRRGLMMGLAFPDEATALTAVEALFKAGVFVVWANNDRSVIQFLPPLTLTEDEAEELIDRVFNAFG